jgi:hypothetical protein
VSVLRNRVASSVLTWVCGVLWLPSARPLSGHDYALPEDAASTSKVWQVSIAPDTLTSATVSVPAIEARDLLDDLAAVLGTDRVRLANVPALLRDLAPTWGPYRALTGVQLRDLLDDAGIRTTTRATSHGSPTIRSINRLPQPARGTMGAGRQETPRGTYHRHSKDCRAKHLRQDHQPQGGLG